MATAQQTLTPITNQTPALVSIADVALSGAHWVKRFPGSAATSDLARPFRDGVDAFLGAMRAAGAVVTIAATFRPAQRAHLMHWAWKIVNQSIDPRKIPTCEGVTIQWAHEDADGGYSAAASLAGARDMVNGFQMQDLGTAPGLTSRHTAGKAIDMRIAWAGPLSLVDAYGETDRIDSSPRNGMNARLAVVGASYGVIKYNSSGVDRPHWSDNGA